jgi:adenosylcobinamide-phosphate synthase
VTAAAFAAAGALDALAGDPRWFPHPVRGVGLAAGSLDRLVRRHARGSAAFEVAGGGLIVVTLVIGSAALTSGMQRLAAARGPRYRAIVDVTLAWTTIAARDLIVEVNAVLAALQRDDLAAARLRLARIVGRDTAELDRSGIARALIETLAESFCDGIVAPLCALALGGPPLALAFKAASTLDSMIGHVEAPHTHVGFVAAKLDDALCFVPARIAAIGLAACAPLAGGSAPNALRTAWRDGGKHPSPNAGRVEAAMAGALGVRLGGPLSYDGIVVARALLGAAYAAPTEADVRRARTMVVAASILVFATLAAQLALAARTAKR